MEPIKLKFPVEYEADNSTPDKPVKLMLAEVTPRRAKAKDLRNLPPGAINDCQDNAGIMTVMVALTCNIPLRVAEEIDFEDLMTITKEASSLMPGFQGTGGKSSGESPEIFTSPQT